MMPLMPLIHHPVPTQGRCEEGISDISAYQCHQWFSTPSLRGELNALRECKIHLTLNHKTGIFSDKEQEEHPMVEQQLNYTVIVSVAREMAKDAIRGYLECLIEDGLEIPYVNDDFS